MSKKQIIQRTSTKLCSTLDAVIFFNKNEEVISPQHLLTYRSESGERGPFSIFDEKNLFFTSHLIFYAYFLLIIQYSLVSLALLGYSLYHHSIHSD
jgi:hypothetical protein